MTSWLIQISFGPIQGFISSARRTRDLWGGSRILSEIARAAGESLLSDGATLIYPEETRITQPTDLSNLSNVLLAKLSSEDKSGEQVARAALEAGKDKLKTLASETLTTWESAGVNMRQPLWHQQIDDALETFAAWVEFADGSHYAEDIDKLKSAMAARKNTRDFQPMTGVELGIPKSSLDGLRESVLPKSIKPRIRRRFGLSDNEQLDALGATKRHAGSRESFTPLTRLAVDGWLQVLRPEQLSTLCTCYEPLVEKGYAARVTGNQGAYQSFPYDGGLLFPDRLDKELHLAYSKSEDEAPAGALESLGQLKTLKRMLRNIYQEHGSPCPYMAIMVADGDRMGKFVASATTAQRHTNISHVVSKFADKAECILRKHQGHLVFAGGEDVMGLLPLNGCIEASRYLAQQFKDCLGELAPQPTPDESPSLRIGIAIVHVLEPLGVSRQRADAAEKLAKGKAGTAEQGNALGLQLYIRAGHMVEWRIGFNDDAAFTNLDRWRSAYQHGYLPGRLAYDLRALGQQGIGQGKAQGWGDDLTKNEIMLLVKRAKDQSLRTKNPTTDYQQRAASENNKKTVWEELEKHIATFAQDAPSNLTKTSGFSQSMIELGNQLVLARWLAARSLKDTGER